MGLGVVRGRGRRGESGQRPVDDEIEWVERGWAAVFEGRAQVAQCLLGACQLRDHQRKLLGCLPGGAGDCQSLPEAIQSRG